MFWLPLATLWRRELLRFWREKARVLGFVGSPLVFWLVIGSGFGDLAFYFPGALVLTVMFSAVFSTMSLIEDRREGFLLAMLVSPAPRLSMVLGKTLGAATLAWFQGLVFLLFLPLTRLPVTPAGLLSAAALLFLISLAFTAFGFLLAWRSSSTQAFHGIVNLVLFPLWMVSGAVFPPSKAAGWINVVMALNPLTYSLAAVRDLLGGPTTNVSLGVTVTAATALVLLAVAAHTASERRARNFT
ncbi:MAG: ABC transporter permease [Bryobacteraceae bacterium]|nr:ABC transporter permease [Bryobacteraceae bacterium]